VISVADIQSIQQSNALSFGANTSLSIRTSNRTLEVGDQKELVADSIFFVLQRWLSLRDSRNDRSLPPNLSIPVIEMPSVLQRDVQRHFEELPRESYVEMMQEPVTLFSWLPDTRQLIRDDYSALFLKVFGCQPSKTQDHLNGYILFHGNWSPEIVIYRTVEGKLRRLCFDPEPLLHFLSDHFASIQKVEMTCFDEVRNIPAIIKCLLQLKTDYKFVLPELILPTHLKQPDEVSALVSQLQECMPGIQFDSTTTMTSCKILQNDGSYLLHLYSDPKFTGNSVPLSSEELFYQHPRMSTMDTGSMRQLTEAFQAISASSAAAPPPPASDLAPSAKTQFL